MQGRGGSIVFGARPAAEITTWAISRSDYGAVFKLRAVIARADSFRLRQLPLMFEAPRISKPRGLWVFPVIPNTVRHSGTSLTADLGPPVG